MSNVRYKIYPSLLDKFQTFLDTDMAVEEWWNLDSEGEYKETADEMSDRLEQELLDAINRVPREPIEAADKGTCFNEVIDCLIARRKCEYEGMDIQIGEMAGNRVITAKLNGFEFHYDAQMCKDVAKDYEGAISQHRCEAVLATKYGNVELYGYSDEIKSDIVYDIKTTGRYDFGKYAKGWQKHAYPYCLIESGEMKDVLTEVTVLTQDNEIITVPAKELDLGYRHSVVPEKGWIVLGAKLRLAAGDTAAIRARMEELKEQRVTKQPLEYPSAGSTFKRPEGYFAGKLIQDAGLRGFSVGDAQVSEKHCGFVVNKGNATAADVLELMKQVSEKVNEQFGVTLEPEVKMLGM